MSQPSLNGPTVVSNSTNNRQQVPLRDYLNARIAPFLKKAITESLDAEAEFPLQWLGECLIHQSILYEGNPDRTHIRERFVHSFSDPKPQEERPPEPGPLATAPTLLEGSVEPQSEIASNDASTVPMESGISTQTPEGAVQHDAALSDATAINGIKEEGSTNATHETADNDTEMGGTG